MLEADGKSQLTPATFEWNGGKLERLQALSFTSRSG